MRPDRLFPLVLALLLLAGPGQAQIANLFSAKPKSETAKPAQAPVAVDPRAEAEKQLAEARRQQEAGRIENGAAPRNTVKSNSVFSNTPSSRASALARSSGETRSGGSVLDFMTRRPQRCNAIAMHRSPALMPGQDPRTAIEPAFMQCGPTRHSPAQPVTPEPATTG